MYLEIDFLQVSDVSQLIFMYPLAYFCISSNLWLCGEI